MATNTINNCKYIGQTVRTLRAMIKATQKPVVCLNDGVVYESLSEAGKATGMNASTICQSLKQKRSTRSGLRFAYHEAPAA